MKYLIVILSLTMFACAEAKRPKKVSVENKDTSQKTEMPCPVKTPNSLVLFVFGQSNSTNAGEYQYTNSDPRIVNVYDSKCYVASDPLVGTTSFGGSVWVKLAQNLLATGKYDQIILIPAGVGGTTVEQWSDGDMGMRMISRMNQITELYDVDSFVWHQGEADVDTSYLDYRSRLSKVINRALNKFPNSTFYVSIASVCGVSPKHKAVTDAQLSLVNNDRVLLGVDTDSEIGTDFRKSDGCHFNHSGQEKFAELMAAIL